MNKAEAIPCIIVGNFHGTKKLFLVIEGGSMNILYYKIEFKRGRPVVMNSPLVYSR